MMSNWFYYCLLFVLAAFKATDLVNDVGVKIIHEPNESKAMASIRGSGPPHRTAQMLLNRDAYNAQADGAPFLLHEPFHRRDTLSAVSDEAVSSIQNNDLLLEMSSELEADTDSNLSWKEKMMKYFLNKECKMSDPYYRPPSWLKQMFVLIGVQKGGTKAIHTFLEEHPNFVSRCDEGHRTKELFFFNRLHDVGKREVMNQAELQSRYSEIIQSSCPLAIDALLDDKTKMYLDDTPLYMQDSHLIPQLLNCVMPNTKLMAILRNPTDRAFSHYNFYLERDWCKEKSFDEWVDINIQDLTQAGVFSAKDPYDELIAWERYNSFAIDRKCRTFVTRGLYAIQLLHFMAAMEAAGRPASDMLVIRSDNLQGDSRQQEYDAILNFLGLAPHTLRRVGAVHKTAYESSMDESTRIKLDNFFRPFNDRLYTLLDWEPLWK